MSIAGEVLATAEAPSEVIQNINTYFVLIALKQNACYATHFDMKLQVFIHRIDVVEDILHYSGNDTHCVCVMKIPLKACKQTVVTKNVNAAYLIMNTHWLYLPP